MQVHLRAISVVGAMSAGDHRGHPVLKSSGRGLSSGDADATNAIHRVTVLVASRQGVNLKKADTSEQLRETLRILGSTASSDLMALEVIWQPDGSGDVLSADELVTAYPNLQHL